MVKTIRLPGIRIYTLNNLKNCQRFRFFHSNIQSVKPAYKFPLDSWGVMNWVRSFFLKNQLFSRNFKQAGWGSPHPSKWLILPKNITPLQIVLNNLKDQNKIPLPKTYFYLQNNANHAQFCYFSECCKSRAHY